MVGPRSGGESRRVPRPRTAAPDDPELESAFASARERLARNLQRLRAAAGVSQAKLAERAGVSLVYLGSLEGGRRVENPSLRALAAIAHAIGCSIGDLVDAVPVATAIGRNPRTPPVVAGSSSAARQKRASTTRKATPSRRRAS